MINDFFLVAPILMPDILALEYVQIFPTLLLLSRLFMIFVVFCLFAALFFLFLQLDVQFKGGNFYLLAHLQSL